MIPPESRLDMISLAEGLTRAGRLSAKDLVRLISARPNKFRLLPNNKLQIYAGTFSFPDDFLKIEQVVKMLDFKGEGSNGAPGKLSVAH